MGDVVIIGAGPAGIAAAVSLRDRGVGSMLTDEQATSPHRGAVATTG